MQFHLISVSNQIVTNCEKQNFIVWYYIFFVFENDLFVCPRREFCNKIIHKWFSSERLSMNFIQLFDYVTCVFKVQQNNCRSQVKITQIKLLLFNLKLDGYSWVNKYFDVLRKLQEIKFSILTCLHIGRYSAVNK